MVLSPKKSLPIIILCGGKGTRIQELFAQTPKGLIDINGKNVLTSILENDFFSDIYLAAGHLSEAYIKYLENYNKKNVRICVEKSPLGTGGAINNIIKEHDLEEFFVINGDTFIDVDYLDLLNAFTKYNKPTLAIYKVERSNDYGAIKKDKENRIVSFQEKVRGQDTYVYSGLSILTKELFNSFDIDTAFSLEEDIFSKHVNNLYSFEINKPFYDIGTPERYKKAKKELL